jgi:hypothetical protein
MNGHCVGYGGNMANVRTNGRMRFTGREQSGLDGCI